MCHPALPATQLPNLDQSVAPSTLNPSPQASDVTPAGQAHCSFHRERSQCAAVPTCRAMRNLAYDPVASAWYYRPGNCPASQEVDEDIRLYGDVLRAERSPWTVGRALSFVVLESAEL